MCVKILARWHFEYSPHILIRISGFRIFIRIFLHTAWSSSSRSSSDLNCFATRGRETKIVEISVMRKNFLRGWIFQQKLWNFFSFSFLFFMWNWYVDVWNRGKERCVWCLSYNKAEEKKDQIHFFREIDGRCWVELCLNFGRFEVRFWG